jgi:ubiquinone/menaquinone biosynthesis C-methylase UbiE
MEENKKTLQSGEADNWLKRNLKKVESGEKDEVIETLTGWLIPFKDQIKSLAEIGCGSGHKLCQLSKNLDADGFGLDPSKLAVAYARRNFPQLKVSTGFGDSIPFESQFDLVHLGFFLYLTDRDMFLKTVSEADRITARGGFYQFLISRHLSLTPISTLIIPICCPTSSTHQTCLWQVGCIQS